MSIPGGILLLLGGFAAGFGLGSVLARRRVHAQCFEQQRRLEQALDEARTDPLTGLANRRGFDEQLDVFVRIARRYGSSLAVVLFDVDRLKDVNDRYGHAAGDAALVHFVRVLQGCVRESDYTARIGGDEFALLLPQTDRQGAAALVARIRDRLASAPCALPAAALAERSRSPARSICLIASAGIAQFRDESSPSALLGRADKELYEAKRAADQRSSESSMR